LRAIGAGQVGLLLMGGGHGTRLGFGHPKGMYDIGLPSHKTLFQIQAERVMRLRQLAARFLNKDIQLVHLPWYIMTSDFTHEETMAFFQSHNHFGLPPQDFFFFEQGTLPCLTTEGKIILESAFKVAAAPNGNGGIYQALAKSGALDDMDRRGVLYLHCYGVDNVLVKVSDPTFMGFAITVKADAANKTVRKDIPSEAVGVMCRRNGVPHVIEYSEIPRELSELRNNATGHLIYNAANVANHFFTSEFLRRMANHHLPFHIAKKAIPYADDNGQTVAAKAANGVKTEMFVFDVFAFAKKMVVFQVLREGEFTALKNAPGKGISTPETARQDLSQYHSDLAVAHGAVITKETPDAVFEISPLVSYEGENLSPRVRGKTFRTPFELA